jgi:hypothetical protein
VRERVREAAERREVEPSTETAAPPGLTPTGILALQRTAGNQAVRRLLARKPAASRERMESFRSAHDKGIVPNLLAGLDPGKPDAAVLDDLLEAFGKIGFDYNMSNTETKRFLAGDTLSGDCQTLVRSFVEVARGLGFDDAQVIPHKEPFGIFTGGTRTTIDGKTGNCDGGTKWVFDDHYWAVAGGVEYDVLFGTKGINKSGWVKQNVDSAKQSAPYGSYYRGTFETPEPIDVYATGDMAVPNRYSIGPNKEAIQRKDDANAAQKVAEAVTAARTGMQAVATAVATALTKGAPAEAAKASFEELALGAEAKAKKSLETAELKKGLGNLVGEAYDTELKRIAETKQRDVKRAEGVREEQSGPAYWADQAVQELEDSVVDKAKQALTAAEKLSSPKERAKVVPLLEEAIGLADRATIEAEHVKHLVTEIAADSYGTAAKALASAKQRLEQLRKSAAS